MNSPYRETGGRAPTDPVERWNNPRWHAVYGSLVAMHIHKFMDTNGCLPNDQQLRIIVRESRGHADDVEKQWQEMVAMESKL